MGAIRSTAGRQLDLRVYRIGRVWHETFIDADGLGSRRERGLRDQRHD